MRIAQAGNLRFRLAKEADRRLWGLQKSEALTWRSPARFGSISAKEINNSGADIIHLHWVTDGFLTIESIGQIKKPIVWSLYDALAFSGSEHYATEVSGTRSAKGYQRGNRTQRILDLILIAGVTIARRIHICYLMQHSSLTPCVIAA